MLYLLGGIFNVSEALSDVYSSSTKLHPDSAGAKR